MNLSRRNFLIGIFGVTSVFCLNSCDTFCSNSNEPNCAKVIIEDEIIEYEIKGFEYAQNGNYYKLFLVDGSCAYVPMGNTVLYNKRVEKEMIK